jgi:2-aminoadipate transaminase
VTGVIPERRANDSVVGGATTTRPCSDVVPFSQRAQRARESPISYLMHQAVVNPGILSLAAGLVDGSTLPRQLAGQGLDQLLDADRSASAVLQYGTTEGAAPLREALWRYLAELEGIDPEQLGISPAEIIATTGSQQLLSLVADVLLDPGDICLVAAPTYFVFLGVLAGVGARIESIPTDDGGLRIDALDERLRELSAAGELSRVKLIYVVSDYDNPSGRSLASERRRGLVDVARKWSTGHRILILEDAAYRELRYDGPVRPSVWSHDADRQQVILAMTFSKSFSPGIRVGWGVVPRAILPAIVGRKGNEDFGSPNLNQHLLARVLNEGWLGQHLQKVRAGYRAKRDVLLAELDQELGSLRDRVSWTHPEGGLYVWLSLPPEIETGFSSELFRHATQECGVMYVPGELCYAGPVENLSGMARRPSHQLRLSFGNLSPDQLREAVRRLGRAVRSVLGSEAP